MTLGSSSHHSHECRTDSASACSLARMNQGPSYPSAPPASAWDAEMRDGISVHKAVAESIKSHHRREHLLLLDVRVRSEYFWRPTSRLYVGRPCRWDQPPETPGSGT